MVQVTSGDTPYASAKKFEDLNLSSKLVKGVYVEMKCERNSKIKAKTGRAHGGTTVTERYSMAAEACKKKKKAER